MRNVAKRAGENLYAKKEKQLDELYKASLNGPTKRNFTEVQSLVNKFIGDFADGSALKTALKGKIMTKDNWPTYVQDVFKSIAQQRNPPKLLIRIKKGSKRISNRKTRKLRR